MELQRTVVSPSTSSLFFPPPPKTHHPSTKNPVLPFSTRQFRLNLRTSLKCSANYGDNHQYQYQYQAVEYGIPRPPEIPWSKELANTVNLIGNVGNPVEIRNLPSGKSVAWTSIAVRKSDTEATWVKLTFWDILAQVAASHVRVGDQIYVSGRLVADVVEKEEGKPQTYYKVVVQRLNFVEKFVADSNNVASGAGDFRVGAVNGKRPTEEMWQAFFANPTQWWDNRKDKRTPKHPDFKHKDTGEALWVDGWNNPSWVDSQLAILDERMESFHDQESSGRISSITSEDLMGY
ncbi:hypothetical protein Tsubulata_014170 [Turnera subulata]|uniref:Uncharacterized protein n=1 Tax=Turnera subulata TaxID=218843 RepID=A0A9Q0FG55_9ROSI|nr:hypothetical protein Tsubulata_014170 [Turnera subulata]